MGKIITAAACIRVMGVNEEGLRSRLSATLLVDPRQRAHCNRAGRLGDGTHRYIWPDNRWKRPPHATAGLSEPKPLEAAERKKEEATEIKILKERRGELIGGLT